MRTNSPLSVPGTSRLLVILLSACINNELKYDHCSEDTGSEYGWETIYLDSDDDGYGVATTLCSDEVADLDTAVHELCDESSGDASADGCVEPGDCDDANASAFPEAEEVCDGIDNDCDGDTDEEVIPTWYQDSDEDDFGDDDVSAAACEAPVGYVADSGDCDDGEGTTFPGADELCDGVDNDCDGEIDDGLMETWYKDSDSDDYGNDIDILTACEAPRGYVAVGGDCDDENPNVYPGAPEVADGVDNDCSGGSGSGDALPMLVDLDEIVQLTVTGYSDSSGLNRACVQPESLERVVLGDDSVAVFPVGSEGDKNIAAATTTLPLDSSIEGVDRSLLCLGVDLDEAGEFDVLVGSPGTDTVQVIFKEYPEYSTLFTDSDTSGFGAALSNLGAYVVVGSNLDPGKITVAYDSFEYDDEVPAGARTQLTRLGGAAYGSALDARSDLTGDGVVDLVVGAQGSIYIVDGADLLRGIYDEVAEISGSGEFGTVLTTTADFTGDGVSEILVSAPDTGSAWLIPGLTYGSFGNVEDAAWLSFSGEPGAGGAVAALATVGGGEPAVVIADVNNDRVLFYREEHLSAGARLSLDETAASTVLRGEEGSLFGSYLFDALDGDSDGVSELGVCASNDQEGRGACFIVSTIQ